MGLPSRSTRLLWIRGSVCGLACNSAGVTGRSPNHHCTRRAHNATHKLDEVRYRAASGTASGACRKASGTAHGTRRAASGAAHRTRRATERAPRHHHHHRANKVVIRSRQQRHPGPPQRGPQEGRPARRQRRATGPPASPRHRAIALMRRERDLGPSRWASAGFGAAPGKAWGCAPVARGRLCALAQAGPAYAARRWRRAVGRSYSVELIFWKSAIDLCAVIRSALPSWPRKL